MRGPRDGKRHVGVLRLPGPHSPRLTPHGPVALSPTVSPKFWHRFFPSRRRQCHRGASYGFSRSFRSRITNAVEKRCRSRRDDNCGHFRRTQQKYSHGQHFDPSVPRGNDGRGESRRRRPRFLQRCRNDNPLSVAANGSIKNPSDGGHRAGSWAGCDARRRHRTRILAPERPLENGRTGGARRKKPVPKGSKSSRRTQGFIVTSALANAAAG